MAFAAVPIPAEQQPGIPETAHQVTAERPGPPPRYSLAGELTQAQQLITEAQRIVNGARVHGELFGRLGRVRSEVDQRLHVASKALGEAAGIAEPGRRRRDDPDAWRYFESPGAAQHMEPFTDDDDEELLTVEQAAERLGWKAHRVYEAIYAGKLQKVGEARAVRISVAAIRAFIADTPATERACNARDAVL